METRPTDILVMVGVAVLWAYWLYWVVCQVRYAWARRRASMTSSLADDLASTLVARPAPSQELEVTQ